MQQCFILAIGSTHFMPCHLTTVEHTSTMSLVGRDIHHLRVSYLLRKSDDDDVDNNVEKQVGDGDPVLKLNSKDEKQQHCSG